MKNLENYITPYIIPFFTKIHGGFIKIVEISKNPRRYILTKLLEKNLDIKESPLDYTIESQGIKLSENNYKPLKISCKDLYKRGN